MASRRLPIVTPARPTPSPNPAPADALTQPRPADSPSRAWRAKLVSMTSQNEDPACDVAHGAAPAATPGRVLVAVFASPVANLLLRYGRDAGYRPVLVEPDAERAKAVLAENGLGEDGLDAAVEDVVRSHPDGPADVVVTDHHRPELGSVLRDALASDARWIGVMGNPRHPAPHIPALAELGVASEEIARVQRPIGLNIGSRTPAEIAISTLAGLIAERNGRAGGFSF
jgi:xanthine dehydrogenase accessory factor